jgi:hypothetical protein
MKYAIYWFTRFPDNSISTKAQLENAFMEKWGERRDNKHLLVALSSEKRNENEIVEEFDKMFSQIVQRLHENDKPPEAIVFIYYIDAFDGEIDFQIRDE